MGCNTSKSTSASASTSLPPKKNENELQSHDEEEEEKKEEEINENGLERDDSFEGPTEPEDYDFKEGEIPLSRFVLGVEEFFATPHNLLAIQRMYQSNAKESPLVDPELRPPPLTNKSDIIANINIRRLDQQADSCSLDVALSGFPSLVDFLCKGILTQVEVARVFFRWMGKVAGNKEVDKLTTKYELEDQDPLYYVQGIRDGKAINYVILLHKLFYEAGIVVEVVRGVTKSAQYKIGHYVNTSHASVWLAVLLDNQWRFIDPIWACQVLQGYDSGEWSIVDEKFGNTDASESREEHSGSLGFKINDFYFLTDPHYSILEHFPYDPRWQLLPRQVSLEEFEEMPFCEPEEMDRLGLEIVSHPKCVFEIKDSATSAIEKKLKVHIKKGQDNCLEFTEDTSEFNVFSSQLYIHSSTLSSEETGNVIQYKAKKYQLQHFCVTGHSVKLKELFITVIPPVPGMFLLKLFGARCADDSMKHVISYVFHCRQAADVVPIPPGNLTEWGPGGQTAEAGLDPISHPESIIELKTGETIIKFYCKNTHLRFKVKLTGTETNIRFADQYAIHWMEGSQCNFKIRAPKDGLYATLIYCVLPKGMTVPICDYLIDGQVPCVDSHLPFPRLTENQYLGPDEKSCQICHTQPESHKFGYFEVSEKTIKMIWNMTKFQVVYCVTMFLQDERGHHDYSQYVLTETVPSQEKVYFSIKFPQIGYYLLSIGGLAENATSVQHLCNYVIKMHGEPYCNAMPFPKMPTSWQKGLRLMHPESNLVEPNKYVQIIIRSDSNVNIEELQLRSEKPLMMFYMQRGEDNTWKSTIDAGPPGTKWKLSVTKGDKNLEGPLFDFIALGEKESANWNKIHQENLQLYEQVKQKRLEHSEMVENLCKQLNQQQQEQEDVVQEESKDEELDKDETEVMDTEALDELIKQAETEASKTETSEEEKRKQEEIAKKLKIKSVTAKLKAAIKKEQVEDIELILKEESDLIDEKLTELANRTISLINLKRYLKEASTKSLKQKNPAILRKAIGKISNSEYKSYMEKVLTDSYVLLARIERLEALYSRILNLDRKAISELRTYTNPKNLIVDILRATLLLLGEYEKRTNTWLRCKSYLNPTGKYNLQHNITEFDSDNLHPAIVARAKVILAPYKEEEAVQVSAAAAAFYGWSVGVIADKEETCDARQFVPANLDRQRKLLNVSKEEHNQLLWAEQKK